MKNNGLRNRFSEETKRKWLDWYECMVCFENGSEVLHHIVSPSSHLYVDGEHNESILNSCPVHNQKCHVGNESFLYDDATIKTLLERTLVALASLYQFETFAPTEADREFLRIYTHLYSFEKQSVVQSLKQLNLSGAL